MSRQAFPLETPAARAALEVLRVLRRSGHPAYFAGGCVRDLLLGRVPQDYDVATGAVPERVQELFRRTVAVGAQFGVVIVMTGDEEVEVATFREDHGYADGRRPSSIAFSDAKRDVERRDFTVNGLLWDPETGEVLDYVGGEADLAARRLRAIGDPLKRFEEDRLRMLRAVRFAAQLGFEIEPATAEAVRAMADRVTSVSWERICHELTRTLLSPGRRRGFELLDSLGLMPHVLPELVKMKGVQQPIQYHPEGDVWVHTLLVLGHLQEPVTPTLGWAALLHDVGKPSTYKEAPDRIRFDNHDWVGARMSEKICRRLKMSNDDTERIEWLVRTHLYFKDLPQMREAKVRRFLSEPAFPEALQLHYADCMGAHQILDLHKFCQQKLAQYAAEPPRMKPILTGAHLIALGFAPGPGFKPILEAALDEQLEGRIADEDQALAWARDYLQSHPI